MRPNGPSLTALITNWIMKLPLSYSLNSDLLSTPKWMSVIRSVSNYNDNVTCRSIYLPSFLRVEGLSRMCVVIQGISTYTYCMYSVEYNTRTTKGKKCLCFRYINGAILHLSNKGSGRLLLCAERTIRE